MNKTLTRRFFLNRIEIICSIGILDSERAEPQRIIIDIEVLLDPDSEPVSDDIGDALNYDDIRQIVTETAISRHFDLQETLARAIFDAVGSLPTVQALRVRTAKPDIYENIAEAAYQLSNLD